MKSYFNCVTSVDDHWMIHSPVNSSLANFSCGQADWWLWLHALYNGEKPIQSFMKLNENNFPFSSSPNPSIAVRRLTWIISPIYMSPARTNGVEWNPTELKDMRCTRVRQTMFGHGEGVAGADVWRERERALVCGCWCVCVFESAGVLNKKKKTKNIYRVVKWNIEECSFFSFLYKHSLY